MRQPRILRIIVNATSTVITKIKASPPSPAPPRNIDGTKVIKIISNPNINAFPNPYALNVKIIVERTKTIITYSKALLNKSFNLPKIQKKVNVTNRLNMNI